MLTNEKLGQAIASAIQKKIDSGSIRYKADVARHFGIKPSSLREWETKGTVSKNKLGALFQYFSDVVDQDHWVDERLSSSTSAVQELSRKMDNRTIEGSYSEVDNDKSNTKKLLTNTDQKNSESLVISSAAVRRVDVNYSVELVPGQFVTGQAIQHLNKNIEVTPQEFSPTAFAIIYTGSAMGEMLEHQQPIIIDERKPKPGDLCILKKADGFMFCVFESESPFGAVFRLKGTRQKYTTDASCIIYKVLALRNASDIQ